jgi:hypothetical protein
MTLSRRKTLALIGGGHRRRRGRRRLRDHPPARPRLRPGTGRGIRRSAHARAQLGDPRAESAQPAAVEGGPVTAGQARPLPRSRPPAAANRPVQSADHRIAGMFSGASAHGRAAGRATPSRSTCSPKARTPPASTNARSRSAASAHATRAPDPLFAMPPPAQQQGALRHVPPGPGRRAGAHRLGRAAYRGRGLTDARHRSRSCAP